MKKNYLFILWVILCIILIPVSLIALKGPRQPPPGQSSVPKCSDTPIDYGPFTFRSVTLRYSHLSIDPSDMVYFNTYHGMSNGGTPIQWLSDIISPGSGGFASDKQSSVTAYVYGTDCSGSISVTYNSSSRSAGNTLFDFPSIGLELKEMKFEIKTITTPAGRRVIWTETVPASAYYELNPEDIRYEGGGMLGRTIPGGGGGGSVRPPGVFDPDLKQERNHTRSDGNWEIVANTFKVGEPVPAYIDEAKLQKYEADILTLQRPVYFQGSFDRQIYWDEPYIYTAN